MFHPSHQTPASPGMDILQCSEVKTALFCPTSCQPSKQMQSSSKKSTKKNDKTKAELAGRSLFLCRVPAAGSRPPRAEAGGIFGEFGDKKGRNGMILTATAPRGLLGSVVCRDAAHARLVPQRTTAPSGPRGYPCDLCGPMGGK